MSYTENDSKVGNLARRLRKFFVWSEPPLCKHKPRVKRKNLLHSQRSQKPTFESFSVYLLKMGKICILILALLLVKRFCYRQTDGFALYKIYSSLSYCSDWETASLPSDQHEQLMKLFDQPFYYLARGAQAYVFASEDGKTVIKFIRIYHLLPPLWIRYLNFPLPLQPCKIGKMIRKREELAKDFQSYKTAFQELKKETGLLYVHLNKTNDLKKKVVIHDNIGIAYEIDLDEMEFIVQKKASLLYPSIEHIVATEGIETAKMAITSLIDLLKSRRQKGIYDKDPDLNTNFGFIDKTAVQIDIGRFSKGSKLPQDRDDIFLITDSFRQWLDQKYPPLSAHLLQEIGKI